MYEKKFVMENSSSPLQRGVVPFLLLIFTVGLFAMGFFSGMYYLKASQLDNNITTEYATSDGLSKIVNKTNMTNLATTSQTDSKTIIDVANATTPSVVEITTEIKTTNSMFNQAVATGAGSGVIMTEDGYIITNNHVIEGADKITVTLNDGTKYDAKLIGTDSTADIAVIKIDAKGLKYVTLGNSDELQVGETAIVVGNPLGVLGGTVTDGIISALNREIKIDGVTMNLLQTNAAVNPGNSGGGLFNGDGELVGIVVAKSAGTGVEGLGFAIPINDAKAVIDDIMEYGYVRGKAQLGIYCADASNVFTAMQYGVNELGLYIQSVNSNSCAEKAGLKSGDMIVEFNGDKIESMSNLSNSLAKCSAGDTAKIKVKRGSKTLEFEVVLDEYTPA